MLFRKPQILSLLLFAAVLALPFCFKPATTDLGTGVVLRIVSPHHESIRREFETAFTEWLKKREEPSCRIEWVALGGTQEILQGLDAAYRSTPGGLNCDLMWGGGMEPYLKLKSKNYLLPCTLDSATLAQIPETIGGIRCYDLDKTWYGTAISVFGILTNQALLTEHHLPPPEQWEDLAKPLYVDQVGIGNPSKSGSVYIVFETILQVYGWEKGWSIIFRMAGNTRQFTEGGSSGPRDCQEGRVALAPTIDLFAWPAIRKFGKDRLGFVAPEGMTLINPDAAAILKGAPHPAMAALFMQFLLSGEAQRLWVKEPGTVGGPKKTALFRMPIRKDIFEETHAEAGWAIDPFQAKGAFHYDFEKASLRQSAVGELLQALVVDLHEPLRRAWKNKIATTPDGGPQDDFDRMPMTEEALLTLLKNGDWSDPVKRMKLKEEWARARREGLE